jgi:hydroxylysine kinase
MVVDAALVDRVAPVSEADAERIVAEHWDIAVTARRVPGEKDDNFVLLAPAPRFVLKVVHPSEPAALTDFTTRLITRLQDVPDVPTEALVPTTAGLRDVPVTAPDGHVRRARMTTFVEGRPLRVVPSTPVLRRELGRSLARLGRALETFPAPAEPRSLLWDLWQADAVRPMLDELAGLPDRGWVVDCLERFAVDTRPRLSRLRRQLVHNDLSADNVFVAGDGTTVAGIIDFGDVLVTQLVNDVAIAMTSQLDAGADPLGRAVDLLCGYHEVTPLRREEIELLYDLVRLRIATRLVISEWRALAHPENRAYILRNTRAAWTQAAALPVDAGPAVSRRLLAACAHVEEDGR